MSYLEGLMAADKNFLARKEMRLREEADARAKREFEWRQEEQDRQSRERTAIEQQRSLGLSPFISRGDAGFDPFNFGQGAQPAVQAPLPEVPPAAQTLSPPVRSPIGSAPQTGDDRLFILNNELRLAQASGNQADVAGLTREIERVTSGGKTTEPSVKKGTTWRSSPEESNKGIVLPDYYNKLLAQRDAAANDPAAVARIEADLRDVVMEMRRAKVNLPSPLPTMAARPQGGLMPPQAQAPMPEMVAATGLQPQQTAVQTPAVQMQPQATQAPQAAPQDITSTAEWKALESAYALAKTPEQLLMVQNAAIALVNRHEYAGLAAKVMQATPEQLEAFARNFTDATHVNGSAKTNADGTMTISLDGGKPATYRRDQLAVIVVGLSKLRKGDPSGVSDIASVNKDLAESVQRDIKNNVDVATVNNNAAQTSGQISDGRSRAEVQAAQGAYYTEQTSALSEARDYRKQASEKVQQFTELSIADQNGPVGKALMNQIQILNMKAGGGMPGLGRQSSDQPQNQLNDLDRIKIKRWEDATAALPPNATQGDKDRVAAILNGLPPEVISSLTGGSANSGGLMGSGWPAAGGDNSRGGAATTNGATYRPSTTEARIAPVGRSAGLAPPSAQDAYQPLPNGWRVLSQNSGGYSVQKAPNGPVEFMPYRELQGLGLTPYPTQR